MTRPRRILILFGDDSTLFFATRMRALLQAADSTAKVVLGCFKDEMALSPRQLDLHIPKGDYQLLDLPELNRAACSADLDAIIVCKVPRALTLLLQDPAYRDLAHRPRIMAFLPGLDFFPDRGMRNRLYCDSVYLFPESFVPRFKALQAEQLPAQDMGGSVKVRHVGFGHPACLRPEHDIPQTLPEGDIYFFGQALSPLTRRGRVHLLQVMAAIARKNPDRTVWIKLRHLPEENATHVHRERFSYPSLMSAIAAPDNLRLTACDMDTALAQAALGIVCTSTAAMDLIRAGVPTMVHLDYVDNYVDTLVPPMRDLFADSNLIVSLEGLLHLRYRAPNRIWVESMFCDHDLGLRVLDDIFGEDAPLAGSELTEVARRSV
ncbi:hypothetical protein DS909_22035 [Phaeobacter gallaeciensis]|uniref:Uncharacterized protein n=1 Tax=Phaeobacter gallaeciensis TaxID=60890 RepID=A0A366WN59_9RHOB|nr:DUF6716 putative glycosyltransferase [Phaeobacter gallaeciensis]RBW50301.1 hypothetical protein DS909_22035 [Phaeobacter gallaeciensis]